MACSDRTAASNYRRRPGRHQRGQHQLVLRQRQRRGRRHTPSPAAWSGRTATPDSRASGQIDLFVRHRQRQQRGHQRCARRPGRRQQRRGALITDSFATGNVTASGQPCRRPCSTPSGCQIVTAGGLVGFNAGTIRAPLMRRSRPLQAATCRVGSNAVGGGLVGFNTGIIRRRHGQRHGDRRRGHSGPRTSHGTRHRSGRAGRHQPRPDRAVGCDRQCRLAQRQRG